MIRMSPGELVDHHGTWVATWVAVIGQLSVYLCEVICFTFTVHVKSRRNTGSDLT